MFVTCLQYEICAEGQPDAFYHMMCAAAYVMRQVYCH